MRTPVHNPLFDVEGGTATLLVVTLYLQLTGCFASQKDIDSHLEMGKKFLAAGQLADALTHYHAAVELDPNNYLTYFRRATVYLAIGKSKSAMPDLERVLEIKPDFQAARVQLANILLKQGHIERAEHEYRSVLAAEPGNAEAREQVDFLPQLLHMEDEINELLDREDYNSAEILLSKLIESCPWDATLRERRADCYINQAQYFKAINDIKSTTKLVGDNTAAFYRISDIHYQLGEADDALREIRECLKLDPDHKECFPFYKKIKKVVKAIDKSREFRNEKQWEDCVERAKKIQTHEPHLEYYQQYSDQQQCHCNSQAGLHTESIESCNRVLERDNNNVEAICDLAELYTTEQEYEQAIDYYQKALGISEGYHRAKEGLDKAQKLLKQSNKRDYYKILGVSRNAQKKDIIEAYAKLAAQWHLEKFESEDEKKSAEKKFMDIVAAKEVLTDQKMRQKFDRGEDPLDPEQQVHGFNPFGQGGGFGGQDGNFEFHYASVNLDHVARDMDFHSLQENIMNITYCNIELELDMRLVDPNFIKLFKLAQLTIEYLLHSQDYLSETILDLEGQIKENNKNEENLNSKMRKLESEIERFKKEGHKRKKLLMEQQHMIDAGADNYHKCMLCPKAFMNITFLQNHCVRRHGQTIQDIQSSQRQPEDKMSILISEQLTEIQERLAFTESQLQEERKSLKEMSQRETVLLAQRDEEHLKQLSVWQGEQERQHKQDMERIQNMLLTEIKELHEKQGATQSALDAAQGSGAMRQSNLGTLRDDIDVERDALNQEKIQIERQKEELKLQMDALHDVLDKDAVTEKVKKERESRETEKQSRIIAELENSLRDQEQKNKQLERTYKQQIKEMRRKKKSEPATIDSAKRTLTFSDSPHSMNQKTPPPVIEETPPTDSTLTDESEGSMLQEFSQPTSTIASGGDTLDDASTAKTLSTQGTLDLTAKSKQLRDALISNPKLLLDTKKQLRTLLDNELKRWDVDPDSSGISSSKLASKLQLFNQEKRRNERKYRDFSQLREMISQQVDESAANGGSPPRAPPPKAAHSPGQPTVSKKPESRALASGSLGASGATDSWGTTSSKWTSFEAEKVKAILDGEELSDEEGEEEETESGETGSEEESETALKTQTNKPAAPARPIQPQVIESRPVQRLAPPAAIKMPTVSQDDSDSDWDEDDNSELKERQKSPSPSAKSGSVMNIAAKVESQLLARNIKAPAGSVNTLQTQPTNTKKKNTDPILQDLDDDFSISSIEDKPHPHTMAVSLGNTYSSSQWTEGSNTINSSKPNTQAAGHTAAKRADQESVASSLTSVTVTGGKNENDSDWSMDSDLDLDNL